MIRILIRAGAGLLLLALAGYGALLTWVVRVSREDQSRPVDAIVVLGAAHYRGRPSPVLRARLNHALTLHRAGLAPLLIVTGGTRRGDDESEAAVQRRYLVERGVPESRVVVLGEGHSTDESMSALGWWVRRHAIGPILLVSDGFHLARLRIEASRRRLVAATSPAPGSPIVPGSRREWGYLCLEALKVPVAWVKGLRNAAPPRDPTGDPIH